MFANAIQTLSNMAINEAGLDLPKTAPENLLEDYKAMMESLPVLTEDESRFRVEMIPVRANKRFSRYLIEMADLSRYMISNNIHDVKQAVCNILEANNLTGQYNNVGIIIENDIPAEDKTFNNEKTMGYGLLGKLSDTEKIRQIANSKKFMDVLTGRYGLPLIRSSYSTVGLLESSEDAEIKKKDNETVIHEEEPDDKDKKEEKCDKEECKEKECDCGKDDCPICNPKDDDKKDKKKKDKDDDDDEAEKEEQPGDEDAVQESSLFYRLVGEGKKAVSESAMTDHERQIQRIRDIVAGKYDNDDL